MTLSAAERRHFMKFEITIFDNVEEYVLVKNENPNDFNHRSLKIEAGQEIQVKPGLAKLIFGDWDKEGIWGEMKRREVNKINLMDIKIQTKTAQKQDLKNEIGQEVITKTKEPEFVDLDHLDEEKEEAPAQCAAIARSGKQCKNKAEFGEYCKVHKAKGDK